MKAESNILPPGEYGVALKLLCTPDECRLVAEVNSGRYRGSQLVVQTFRNELPEDQRAARDQCIRILRVKYINSDILETFIEDKSNPSESWLEQYFDPSGKLLRIRLCDEYEAYHKERYTSEK